MEQKYYSAYFNFIKAGKNRFFAENLNDDTTHIISAFEAELLMSLSGCKTLFQHGEILKESELSGISSSLLTEIFYKWIKFGFLRKENNLIKGSSNNTSHHQNNDLISCCVTYNRPNMIKRWLDCRIHSPHYYADKIPIIICDDTDSSKELNLTTKIIKDRSIDYPGRILHFDMGKKKNLSQEIIKRLGDNKIKELTDFLMSTNGKLFNAKSTGSNRNALLLATAGYRIYSSDDDIEYIFYSKKEKSKFQFILTEQYQSKPLFTPEITLLSDKLKIKSNYNMIDEFKRITGESISSINPNDISLDNIPSNTAMLIEKNNLIIQTISAGYCGGRWYQNPYLPLLQEEERIFFDNINDYNNIKKDGFNINSTMDYIMDRGDFLMGGTYSTDNRRIPPPCLPLGRREDTNFGILLNRCFEYGLTMHIPYALFHNPAEKLSFSESSFKDVSLDTGVYSTLLIRKMTSEFLNPPGENRLKETGKRFQEFGNLNISDFEEQLKLIQLGYIKSLITHINYLFDLHERSPEWWIKDMLNYKELLIQEALSDLSVIPAELRKMENKKKALTLFQHYIKKCGEMLYWWPEIWEAARQLNMEGQGFITPT